MTASGIIDSHVHVTMPVGEETETLMIQPEVKKMKRTPFYTKSPFAALKRK